jgi:hypothetical protein
MAEIRQTALIEEAIRILTTQGLYFRPLEGVKKRHETAAQALAADCRLTPTVDYVDSDSEIQADYED